MADLAPHMMRLHPAPQTAMFAAEFIDPISGRLVGDGLRVRAAGLGPPTLTPSNRFVWLDRGEPEDRRIRLEAQAADRRFAPFVQEIEVPAHKPGVPARALIFRRRLIPTRLYDPPPGMIAVGGMLVEDDGRPPVPVAGVKVRIHFRHAEQLAMFRGGYTAFTDDEGGFTAVVRRLRDVRPDPAPGPPGTFEAWLRLRRGDEERVSETLSLRLGRMLRIPRPLQWAGLSPPEEE